MHIVWLHIRTLFIFHQSHNHAQALNIIYRGVFLLTAVTASRHLTIHHLTIKAFSVATAASLNFKTLKPNTRFYQWNQKIIGTIFWFKFLKACQTRDKKGRKESGFLNLLTKSFSRLKVLNWLTKKSFIQFGVSSYPHFKSPP